MNIPIEEKRAEAISRMNKIGLFPIAVKDFRTNGLVQISESPTGYLYYLETDVQKRVKEFEDEYDALVYLVVRAKTEFGIMDSYLYVSDHKEEWGMDNEDLDDGIAMTYTYNYDAPWCSEFGSIGFRLTAAAGIARTA